MTLSDGVLSVQIICHYAGTLRSAYGLCLHFRSVGVTRPGDFFWISTDQRQISIFEPPTYIFWVIRAPYILF